MDKCRAQECTNEAVEGKKYCKYHLAQREDKGKKLIGVLSTVSTIVMGSIGAFRKFKK